MEKQVITYAQFNKVVKNSERRGNLNFTTTTTDKEVYNDLHGKYENVFEMKGGFMLVHNKGKEKFISNPYAKDLD